MFCSKCGAEIEENTRFCPKCGTAISAITENIVKPPERKRHGFVTFWLVLGVIFGPILGIMCFISPQFFAQSYPNATYSSIMIMGLITMVGTIANILILCWKKIGLWLLFAVYGVSFLISISMGVNIGYILSSLVGIAIVYGILHIRKNGKTTWEQLV
jgi:hypothetical protein